MRLDQGNQALLGHDLIHFNQEALAAGLLTFAGVLGISEGHLFHGVKPSCSLFHQSWNSFSEFS
jgi:hypothetical protein